MDHRFRGRCGFEGGVDDDPVGAVGGGVAVRAAGDRLAGDGPSAPGHDRGHAVVDRVRIGAGEELGDFFGLGVSLDRVGLGVVEHRQNRERGHLAGFFVAGVGVGLGDGAGAVAVDPDRFLALADLPAALLPGTESGHLGCLWFLSED